MNQLPLPTLLNGHGSKIAPFLPGAQRPVVIKKRGFLLVSIKRSSLAILFGLAAGLAGCQNDEIRHYQAPKDEPVQAAVKGDHGPVRLLAAIVPHGDRTWYFKLSGPAQVTGEHQEEFTRFVQSVHFTDQPGQPVSWKVPESWKQKPGSSEMRYATFGVDPKDPAPELTVVALGSEGQAAAILPNVNRWRGQIGLPPATEEDLGKLTREITVDGSKATLVDMVGTGGQNSGKMPPFARQGQVLERQQQAAAPAAGQPRLKYEAPPDWKELPASGFRVAAFQIGQGNEGAEVTVIPLGGSAGDLLANVNRWRGQVKLEPITEQDLRGASRPIDVAGSPGLFFDILGSESENPRRRILAVVTQRDDTTWFIKMMGSAAVVEQQKSALERFVRSIQFGGEAK
jgi:hypothetical protein